MLWTITRTMKKQPKISWTFAGKNMLANPLKKSIKSATSINFLINQNNLTNIMINSLYHNHLHLTI